MSDHIEHRCAICASLTHHADECPQRPLEAAADAPLTCHVCGELHALGGPCVLECAQCKKVFTGYKGKHDANVLCLECAPASTHATPPDDTETIRVLRHTIATQAETIQLQRETIKEFDATFALQQSRTAEAVEAWRLDTGREDVQPDLGELLGWLLKEASDGQDAKLREQEAQAAIYVPGMWECPTCGFTQINQTMHPNGIAVNMAQEKQGCPNKPCDGVALRRLTWKKVSEHANTACGGQLARALDAEAELQKARGAAHEHETRCRRLQKEVHLLIAVFNAANVLNDNSHREQNIYGIGDLRDALRHFRRQHIPQGTGAALEDVRRVIAVFRDGGLDYRAMQAALEAMPLPAEPPASIVRQLLSLFCAHSIDMVKTHERAEAAETQLRRISDQLCGVPVEGEVKLSDVYHFVEGAIDRQSDLREHVETKLRTAIGDAQVADTKITTLIDALRKALALSRKAQPRMQGDALADFDQCNALLDSLV